MSFDHVFAPLRVAASKVADKTKAILVTLLGYQVGDTPDDVEKLEDVPIYGGLGLMGRPRPPEGTAACDGLGARTEDGFWLLALLDRRISKARGSLAEGAISLAGYLGQHVTLEDGAGGGAKLTISLAGGGIELVLDSSPGVNRMTAHGTVVVAPPGFEAAAVPVALEPAVTALAAAVVAINQVAAILNVPGPVVGAPGSVTLVPPVVAPLMLATTLKASPPVP